MTSRGRALTVAVVLVTVALALGVGGVAAADDIGTQDDVTVHLVGDDDQDDGEDTIALFEEEVPPEYSIEYIDVADVDEGVIDETDVFVLYDTDEDADLITAVEDDPLTGAVYLDQWGGTSSDGIPDRSAVTGDPADTSQDSFGGEPVEYEIQVDHPIFEGVGAPNETVDIHFGGSADLTYFEGASGETLATAQEQGGTGGPAVAVDPNTDAVLLSSIAVITFVDLEDYTAEAGQILGNAVEFAEPADGPFFAVSDLDAPAAGAPGEEIDVSATITNTGTEADTQDVEFEFDGTVADTEPDVSLADGENTTVTFADVELPVETGVYEHGVSTDNDSQTADISVEEDVFEVSDLDAPAVAPTGGEIDVSATITNTGQEAGTQDVDFVFNDSVAATEPDVELEPGQSTTVTFEDIGLPEEPGVFEHGVFTENDNQTADISVEDEFFAVSNLDAPREVDPGATIEVSATITNTADVVGTQDIVFEFDGQEAATEPDLTLEAGENETVTFADITVPEEEGFYEHGVSTDDDSQTADIGVGIEFTNVAVAESAGDGAETASLFEDLLPAEFATDVVLSVDILEDDLIEEYDIFVFHDFGPDADSDEIITTVEDDLATGAVYLDQQASSNAIPDRSAAIGDPAETDDSFSGDNNVTFDIVAEHPIFDGVAEPNETVEIHDATFQERAWFEDASGDTLAEVGADGGSDGASVAVDPDSGSVLLASIAVQTFVDATDYTAEAGQILGNAVEFAEPEDLDDPFFDVSDLDAPAVGGPGEEIDVSATITNIGGTADTQDVVFEFDGQAAATEPDVSLDPDQNTTVTFDNITLPEELGVYEHGVFTDDDSQTAEISVEEAFFAVSDLDAPAEADPGTSIDVSANITNTGAVAGTQTVEFIFDGEVAATEPDVSLDPDETETVAFTDITLPEESGVYEHGIFTEDDNQTAEIAVGIEATVVTVVQAGDGDEGTATLGLFEDELPSTYEPQVLDAADVDDGVIAETDIFVFHDFEDLEDDQQRTHDNAISATDDAAADGITDDTADLIETVEADITTGAVYLDQWSGDSDAIPTRSAVIGDPGETDRAFSGDGPVTYDIQADHPIFEGVAEPNETVDIHDATFEDRSWFQDASGETLASVGVDSEEEPDGPSVAVDPDSGSVLVSSISVTGFVGADDFTAEAGQILANAVEFAEPEDIEGAFFQVSNLDAPTQVDPGASIDVNATITNIGTEAGTQDIEYQLDGAVEDTEADLSLDPDDETVVEFTNIELDEAGIFEHGVFSANDSATATIQVGAPEIELTEFIQPETLTLDEDIVTEITIENVGDIAYEGEVMQVTNLNETGDAGTIAITDNVTAASLEPNESATFQDTLLDFATINEQVGTEFEPGDEVETGYWVGQDVAGDFPGVPGEPVIEYTFSETITIVEEQPFFEVSDLDAPAEAGPGAEIDVSATITNTGAVAGTQDVVFEFDGEEAATEPGVSLDPDGDTTVTFEDIGVPEEPGTYEHGVSTDDDNETAEITVTDPPQVALSNLSIAGQGESATVLEGDHDVSADMTHVDGGAGEVEATLTIGDAVEETATVDIGEGETATVTFADVTAGLGTGVYDVEMSAQNETLTGELTVSVDVGGDGVPATDTTGDGLLNDLTGDGEFTILDVQALFESFDDDAVQDNVELFDFLGDDRVSIFDVQALFNDLEQ